MKTRDTSLTFIPPQRSAPISSRKRPIKGMAVVTVPYHSGVGVSACTWLNAGFVYTAGAFFVHKFQSLDKVAVWKRGFMLSVFDALTNHSFVSGRLQEMAATGKRMPEEVKAILKQVSAAKKELRQGEARTFAPIA